MLSLMRPGWWATTLVAIALVPTFVLLLFDTGGQATQALSAPTRAVVVGEITPVPASDLAGAGIEMVVRIRADRAIHIDRLIVQLNDQAGSSQDREGRPLQLEPEDGAPKLIPAGSYSSVSMYGVVYYPGQYTYFLSYRSNGTWHSLPPYQTIVIK